MSGIRPAAVANLFYPGDADQLDAAVQTYLQDATPVSASPKALIVPHAGFIYSGPIAATAYQTLKPYAQQFSRVVLIGPSHRVFLEGAAVPSSDFFQFANTELAVDQHALSKLLSIEGVNVNDDAHANEHSLEVQLPFLTAVLDQFNLIPVVLGDASPELAATIIEQFWSDPQTLIVISSDLSHYLPYHLAQEFDAQTSLAIEALRPNALDYDSCCGRTGIQGLLMVAKKHGFHIRTLDLRNSGDTAGDHEQVVGYGAYVVEENSDDQ